MRVILSVLLVFGIMAGLSSSMWGYGRWHGYGRGYGYGGYYGGGGPCGGWWGYGPGPYGQPPYGQPGPQVLTLMRIYPGSVNALATADDLVFRHR